METRNKKSERQGMDKEKAREKKETEKRQQLEKTENIAAASPAAAKRQKKSPTDDLICPITLELPFEPVIAKDGRVYEKEKIEEWIKKGDGNQVRSPITNKMMGTELLPSPSIKNHINTLVETGVITGDLAKNWKEKVRRKTYVKIYVERTLKEAKGGDAVQMEWVAFYYGVGCNGFKQDYKASYMWLDKARKAGNVSAMHGVGICLLRGQGIQKNYKKGIMYVTRAAEEGEAGACCGLGCALATGRFGLDVNKDRAIYWLKKALSIKGDLILHENEKLIAQQKLQELESS